MTTRSVLLLALAACMGGASALVIGGAPTMLSRPALSSRHNARQATFMRADDDENYSSVGSDENFGDYRRASSAILTIGTGLAVLTPVILGFWAYNAGYLTPQ
jgi:hypothetical protein